MADEEEETPGPLYEDEEPDSTIFRWMSALIVILAVAGFFGLAWYAYKSGGDAVDEKDVELIKADKTPVKEAPANPGGMQIPNQDKTVYGLINGKTEKPVVEHILAAPEEPITRSAGDTETWMSSSLKNKETPEDTSAQPTVHADGTPIAPKEQFNPAKVRAATAAASAANASATSGSGGAETMPDKVAVVTPNSLPVIPPATSAPPQPNSSTGTLASTAAPQPKPPAPPVAAAAPKPSPAPTQTASSDSDDADEDAPKTPPAKPAAASASPSAASPAAGSPPSGVRVQLGAYRSESEAEGNWKKIAAKFADDIGGKQHYIARADLGSKGTYYRLQLAPFDSTAAAEQFCIDFVSSGQGCIVARGK